MGEININFFFLSDISSSIGAVYISINIQLDNTSLFLNTLTQDSLPRILTTRRQLVVEDTTTHYITEMSL